MNSIELLYKIFTGTALLVCKMFSNLAKTAEHLRERNLQAEMDENAR